MFHFFAKSVNIIHTFCLSLQQAYDDVRHG
nr:MAG TPA: hypothetical protein [Caudoviricetes sp.]